MTVLDSVVMGFPAILLVFVGHIVGANFRNRTHAMVAFNEPLSYIVLLLTLGPYVGDVIWPGSTPEVFYSLWVILLMLAFWSGYLVGYMLNPQDIIYVGVHQIVEMRQDIEPIVRYYNKEGKLCWQPQGFKEICKTVFFGIDNPLQLSAVSRTRHVVLKSVFLKLEADTIDLAGMEINDYEVEKWGIKFHVQGRKYIPSPNCTDSPYDFLVRSNEYESMFTQYAELQVANAELHTALQTAQVKGGAMVLNALASKDPSSIFMDELGVQMEELVDRKKRSKEMKRATREAQESEAVQDV